MRCPHCGVRNPKGFQFCGHCGRPLHPAPAPQRRWATALFFDLTNFSGYTREHDLEDTHRTVHALLERARDCVMAHGGYVDKFFGDGMLAVFGMKQSRDNEPVRALQAAACAVERALAGAPEELRPRVGLATGLVLLGPLGSEQSQHQTVIGNPVNLAQRLAASAPGGAVWLDETTARMVPEADLAELKPRLFKGFHEPLAAWAFRGWNRGEPPLFGRERELQQVTEWIRAVRQGRGLVRVIAGPLGVGKTYVVNEALRRFSQDVRVLHVPNVELGTPLRETLQQALVQTLGMPPETILDHLSLGELDRRMLAFVLGLEPRPPAPPEDLERTLVRSFRNVLESLSAARPLVVTVRSGPRDHALLTRMLDSLRDEPVPGLVVLVLRRRPLEGADLVLEPLAPDDADAYLRHLNPELTPTRRKAIVKESRGLPLTLRFLALAEDSATSVMAAFQSRLDKLQPLHRKVLLYAALGMPASWPGLLRELLGEESDAAVADLIAEGYLACDGAPSDGSSLTVADPLLKRAACQFLSKEERTRLHEAYWRWLKDRDGVYYAVLAAEHAQRAGLEAEAARAYLRAAEAQKAEGVFRGAERHYLKALALAPADERSAVHLQLAELHLEAGSPETVLDWLEGSSEPEAVRLQGLALARLGRTKEARIQLERYLKSHRSDPEVTLALLGLEPARERLARLEGLSFAGMDAHHAAHQRLLAETYGQLGRFEEAAKAMRTAYAARLQSGHESRAAETALAVSGYYWMLERLRIAAEWADRAVEHARKAHPGLVTTAWSVRAGLWLDQGRAREAARALEQAEEHLDHARTPDERARIHAIRMRFFMETGELSRALAIGEDSYRKEPHAWLAANLALAHALAGGRTGEKRHRELARRHGQEATPPGRLLFALADALRIWRSGGDPRPVLKAARSGSRASGPYLHHLTLILWALYLMQREPQKALALARYLQRRASAGGFVVVGETARLLRAEIALAAGEPVEHLLRFEASLAAQETWRRSLLRQIQSGTAGPADGLVGYGILGAWARLRWREALSREPHGST
ncbi:MAG TPA: hypothetical protein ENK37_00050 [Oceanithermus profundus]|uniref:Guanylate cyclase domain-containing protein n=1 Tax=Oceanithermus profundus TaxID=187137 RepID=A0A7C4ZET5_9DEIN|nr:hypothetical protein [Oceanithermus profundus]